MKIDLNNFCIKKDENNPLWAEFKEWIQDQLELKLGFSADYYGMISGEVLCWFKKETRPQEITLSQWHEAVHGKWEPMVGEEVEIGYHDTYVPAIYIGKTPIHYVGYDKISNELISAIYIRPIKPSLRDKIIQELKDATLTVNMLADIIIKTYNK